MRRFFNPEFLPAIAFAAYRYRFLFVYVIIGVLSLCWEFVVYRGLERLGLAYPYCAVVGVLSGILLAYWGNVRFTFKVPIAKQRPAAPEEARAVGFELEGARLLPLYHGEVRSPNRGLSRPAAPARRQQDAALLHRFSLHKQLGEGRMRRVGSGGTK